MSPGRWARYGSVIVITVWVTFSAPAYEQIPSTPGRLLSVSLAALVSLSADLEGHSRHRVPLDT